MDLTIDDGLDWGTQGVDGPSLPSRSAILPGGIAASRERLHPPPGVSELLFISRAPGSCTGPSSRSSVARAHSTSAVWALTLRDAHRRAQRIDDGALTPAS